LRNRLRVIMTLTLKISINFLKKMLKFSGIFNEFLYIVALLISPIRS